MRSHLISQVVLSQFTDNSGLLKEIDKSTGVSGLVAPADVCYQEIDAAIIGELEVGWATGVENDAKKALSSLHHGDVLLVEKHVNTLKRLIALHFVRTIIYELVERSRPEMEARVSKAKKEVMQQYPQSKSEIEGAYYYNEEEQMKMAVGVMKEQIPNVESYLTDSKFGLEIGVAPPDCHFIIGDLPVLSIDNKGNMGILQGVSVTDANGLAMPLSSTHIVSIKTKPTQTKYVNLTPENVMNANKKLHAISINHYYRLPE